MKTLKKVFFSLLLLVISPLASMASESAFIKEQDGKKCIDLSAAYEEIKNTSQAITGQEQSLDSIKKAQTLATLSNIYSFFMGDNAYCVKDNVAASKSSSFRSTGLMGMVEKGNNDLLAVFPSLGVGEHLALEFIPGYEKNKTFALEDTDPEKESGKRSKELEELLFKDDTSDKELEDIDDDINQIVQDEENAPALDIRGYTYLKDTLKLDKLWGQSRNLAYVFFVLAMIAIGFMIMFRNKLGGQVIVSIGNSIPQLIICLVLVTFSFAIAGIMLDLGRTSMKIVERVFISAQEAAGDPSPAVMDIKGIGRLNDQLMFSFNPFDTISKGVRKVPFIGGFLANGIEGMSGIWEKNGGVGTSLLWITGAYKLFESSKVVEAIRNQEIVDADVTGEGGILIANVGGSVEITGPIEAAGDALLSKGQVTLLGFFFLILLFIVVCLYASVKLFITVLTTYIKIFINIVLGPLQIASGAIPGNFSAVGNWFKALSANILVFPVIIGILNVFNYLGANIDPGKFNFFGNKGVFWPSLLLSIRGIFMFAGYLFAANAPALVNGFLKVGENKTMSAVGDTVKRTAGKIPLIGGMFNK